MRSTKRFESFARAKAADAAVKLVGRFGLTDIQADAILELKLYRLAKLEILAIREELSDKRGQARKLQSLLKSESKRWRVVRDELVELESENMTRRTRSVRSKTSLLSA